MTHDAIPGLLPCLYAQYKDGTGVNNRETSCYIENTLGGRIYSVNVAFHDGAGVASFIKYSLALPSITDNTVSCLGTFILIYVPGESVIGDWVSWPTTISIEVVS